MSLHDIAPRLARARDGLLAQLRRDRAARQWHLERELHLEWLVAHRELQLARSGATRSAVRDAAYMRSRYRKLADAKEKLAAHRLQAVAS